MRPTPWPPRSRRRAGLEPGALGHQALVFFLHQVEDLEIPDDGGTIHSEVIGDHLRRLAPEKASLLEAIKQQ
jgi:hypothetical protein